ncbi:MAG: PSD1 and planctomycete cytochrome C domain-containing protein [Bryobacteraceae bacterium]|nr:PSD1 and planctomycete cytochrome C domain-containing protein [Bryobacteraceae bacterium]
MSRRLLWCLALPLAASDLFENQVRPLLAARCYACHTQNAMGGLRLDSREALLKGGRRGPAVVAGDPSASLLMRAVRGAEGLKAMPPTGALAAAEIDLLERWIRDGADFPAPLPNARAASLWSLRPLPSPQPGDTIDGLIQHSLAAKGLRAAPPADRRTLARRLAFDLTGLPPDPADVDSYVAGKVSTEALVERWLGSPHFGERWARHWLDVARFGEDDFTGTAPKPYPNAWRYRDWVIDAFNRDLPYDTFVKAQIAADLMPGNESLKGGLGLFGLGPWYFGIAQPAQARADERHDRVDMISRGFLGLTVACARCHDHKYDPIRAEDYYALAGVFASAKYQEYPLADAATVERYQAHQKQMKAREAEIEAFLESQREQLAVIFAGRLAELLMAVARKDATGFDAKLYEHWTKYLEKGEEGHPFLKEWQAAVARQAPEAELRRLAEEYQALVFTVMEEKKQLDQQNAARLASLPKPKSGGRKTILPFGYDSDADFNPGADLPSASLPRDRYVLWHGLFKMTKAHLVMEGAEVERFLAGEFAQHLARLRAKLAALKKDGPPAYAYLHGLAEHEQPIDLNLNVRGNPLELGPVVPRHFPEVLGGAPLRTGSGRLELANAILAQPLAARVIANRVWLHLFGAGLVRTPSNFGTMGERPANPELLDYLAARLRDGSWSLKGLIREIVLSQTYQAASAGPEPLDPANRLFGRANRRRLDAEALRDALLRVAGTLEDKLGGESVALDGSTRRTVYARVGRYQQDETLSLFDFPSSSVTAEQRSVTNVPLQRLFFLNSGFILKQSGALAARVAREAPEAGRIAYAYRLLYQREPAAEEVRLGQEFLARGSWSDYAQVLLSANEFAFLD